MRIRKSSKELVYSSQEFKTLDAPAICRHMSIGDDWVEQERDKKASE